MPFIVHRSNALEALVDRLAEIVAKPVGPPSHAEPIVVQSRGMERWLSMELARRLGIWAHPRFPFPRNLVERILGAVLGDEPHAERPFSRESLMWSIAAVLPELTGTTPFLSLRDYLEGDHSGLRRLQLARRIADLFDQYAVYRAELVLGWEHGDEGGWQGILWRALIERCDGRHLAARVQDCLEELRRPGPFPGPFPGLPARVSLFGITTLPPLYLRLFSALAAHVEIHLLQLSPCREYWADLRPQGKDGGSGPSEAPPLLASLGRLGREFQEVLEQEVQYEDAEGDLYVDPGQGSVLTALQSDMLQLRCRGPEGHGGRAARLPFDPDDTSITVHSCHSPMREVEVLRDQLLALFDADPTLNPQDVLVMTPDIATYAPWVDAVFGAAPDEMAIPYSIADQSLRAEHVVVGSFLAVVDILQGRMTAPEVLDLLGHDPVRRRFGLGVEHLGSIAAWVSTAGIRWGVDEHHRDALGQPPYRENTWRFGLERLLLGRAMAPEGLTMFEGRLPCGGAEGDDAQALGGFAELCETLFELREGLQAPRSVAAWRDAFVELLERVVSSQEQPLEHQLVRDALDRLAEDAAAAVYEDVVALAAIRDELLHRFTLPAPPSGFLARGVTVCELLPMRSIPFRVVALLGMNDDTFPRTQRRLSFDLMALHPRAGDRSGRDDDRYQVLECLLAARDRLLVLYVGQSDGDNSTLPPSVVVSELLDAVGELTDLAPGASGEGGTREDVQRAVRDRLVVKHPLQPFSERYFDAVDKRLFSYDAASGRAARRLYGERAELPRFLTELDAPEITEELGLDELVRFFDNPARGLLQGRLGLFLGEDVEILSDREPMDLDPLTRYTLGELLLERGLAGFDPASLYPVVRADGVLPLGVPGRLGFESILPTVAALQEAVGRWAAEEELPPARVELELEGARLTGWLRGIWPRGQVRYRFGRTRTTDLLAGWIRHLALCATAPGGVAQRTVLIGRGVVNPALAQEVVLEPVDDAHGLLTRLMRLYRRGRRIPLRLFPEASKAYVETLLKLGPGAPDAQEQALRYAYGSHTSTPFKSGGGDTDPYVRAAFRGLPDPLAGPPEGEERVGFAAVSLEVFGPLLEHLRREG